MTGTSDLPVTLGLEVLANEASPELRGARLGLLMNRASVDRDLRLACNVVDDAFPGALKAIFSPQHGLWGDAQANMIETDSGWYDPLHVPIHSLYSKTRRPSPEMLNTIDCLLIDLQDVGTRVYTFIWTVLECMKACGEAAVRVIVLDRPNPLGGRIIEGPVLRDSFRSFVGGACTPMRHGLTIGEMARWIREALQIDVQLDVIPMRGWTPDLTYDQCDRLWLPPSPNLPTFDSALVYPGQVLLEGTNLSEGRGTTKPFEVIGAPFIEAEILMDRLGQFDIPGVRFLPTWFQPTFDKWANQVCGGVSLHVTDKQTFRSFPTSVTLLSVIQEIWPSEFRWLDPPYEYEETLLPIDIIYGSSKLRDMGLDGKEASELSSPQRLEKLCAVDPASWSRQTLGAQIYSPSAERFVL